MSKMKWLMALPCLATLCSQGLCAQTRPMSVEELFALADEQSTSIAASRTGEAAAAEALKAAKAQRLPDVTLSLSASYLGDGTIWDRDFSGGRKADMPHFGNNFALEARQVVYAGGAVSSAIRQAELGKELAGLELRGNVQDVRFQLLGSYLDLYKLDNRMHVLQNHLQLTEEVIANMEARRRQGTVLKNDITRYELQREQLGLQLSKTRDARAVANRSLVTALHLPQSVEIRPDTALLALQVQALTEGEWQERAAAGHVGLKKAQAAVLLSEQKVKQERSERLPHVSLVAADHLDGPVTIEVPPLDNNFNYWHVGIGISYNVSSLFKNNSRLRRARLEARQAQERLRLAQEQVGDAVQAGYVELLTAFDDLRTQEKSVRLADENYAVTDNRYKNEMALLTDMLDASNAKLSAALGLVDARIGLVYQFYKMKYLTHTL